MIVADDKALDTPMDYESVAAIGSPLGSASVIVIDDTVNMAWLVNKTVHFFKHESCGKCTPCREGTYWMNRIAGRIAAGKGAAEDIDLLDNVARQIAGQMPVRAGRVLHHGRPLRHRAVPRPILKRKSVVDTTARGFNG